MDNPTPDSAPAGKKKNLKKIIILLLAVVLVGGGAGGGFYYWRTAKASAAESKEDTAKSKKNKLKKERDKEEDTAETPDEKEPEAKDDKDNRSKKESSPTKADPLKDSIPEDENVKSIIELQPFIVNLADSEQARYLRMTINLGVGGTAEAAEKPDQIFNSRVRNAILAVLAVKKSEDVLTVEGKAKLRKEILKAARSVSTEPEVEAIYITEFIVQL